MKGQEKTLVRFLEGHDNKFIVPVYQRNYNWRLENCRQLYSDLVNVVKEGKKSHFFGSIVYSTESRDNFVLIDGQQRVTTISLILIAIVNAINSKAVVPQSSTLRDRIWEDYIINKYSPDENKVRLKPYREDSIAFERLIYRGPSEYIAGSTITRNYMLFYNKITQENPEITVDELFDAITKLEIIDIEIEPSRGDDPQLIFESLNSTGLLLTESDKIRNYVLMDLDTKTQEAFYDKYWDKIDKICGGNSDLFIRDYLTIKTGRISNKGDIYNDFKLYRQGKDIEELLEDMLIHAQAFNAIKTFSIGDSSVDEIARRLDKIDMTVAYPFLIAFIVYAHDKELSYTEMAKVFSYVETYIFRRLMCGYATNALNKIFASLHKEVLKFSADDASYPDVMAYCLEKKQASGTFPDDNEFEIGFSSKNVYKMRPQDKEYLFERLENGDSKETSDIYKKMDEGTYTIEHIMPQTLSQSWKTALGDDWERISGSWLHRIANLTLSGYNSSYSNRTFEEKKTAENGFLQSHLKMNQYIADFDKWTEEELIQRDEYLKKYALKLWPYPKTEFKPVVMENDITSLSDDPDTNRGRIILAYEFQGNKVPVWSWSEMLLKVVESLFEIDTDILYKEAESSDDVWITDKENKDNKKVAEGVYLSCRYNTYNKISFLKKLFAKYGIDEDELTFELRPVASDTETRQ